MTGTSNLTNIALPSPAQNTSPIIPTKRPRRAEQVPKAGSSTSPEHVAAVRPALPETRTTKTSLVIALLSREKGASIDELIGATGWLPHITRAALTGLRKKGNVVASERIAGLTHYHIAAAI